MFADMHDIATQLAMKWARYGPDAAIAVSDDFTRLALDTLALCSMDFRFNSFYRDELHPFISSMGSFLVESGLRSRRPAALAAVFYRRSEQRFFADIEVLRRTAREVLDTRRAAVAADETKAKDSGRKDLLGAMMTGVDPKTGRQMNDDSIIDNLITFLIAGHETTSGLLSFAFYMLLKHPEAYDKAQKEVDSVVGTGAVTVDHVYKLPYVMGVSTEIRVAGKLI